jgi:TM2 domain-containing membrane protein YozV
MKRILIVLALIVSLYPSYAAFGVKKAKVSAEQATAVPENKVPATAPEPAITSMVPAEQQVTASEIKAHKMSFKEKIVTKMFGKKIAKSVNAAGGKSQLTALLLCFFVGFLGIHRFYLGYTWQGIVQLLTLGGFGIWSLIDFIRIIIGDLKPKNGEYEKTL